MKRWMAPGAALVLGALLAGCGEAEDASTVEYGPAVALGAGEARVYLVLRGGEPVELGVAFGEGALRQLPEDGDPSGVMMPDGHTTHEFALEMPAANPTPFQAVTLDWNPAGHEPHGIYDVPHIDLHFYTITHEERRAIHPGDPEFGEKAGRMPAPEYVPAGYAAPMPEAVPAMGVHWVDLSSPELHPEHPERFTHTFLYGTWDGRMIFLEPMVSIEYLETRPDETFPLVLPERFDPGGWYPGAWGMHWDGEEGEYRISLSDFSYRR